MKKLLKKALSLSLCACMLIGVATTANANSMAISAIANEMRRSNQFDDMVSANAIHFENKTTFEQETPFVITEEFVRESEVRVSLDSDGEPVIFLINQPNIPHESFSKKD